MTPRPLVRNSFLERVDASLGSTARPQHPYQYLPRREIWRRRVRRLTQVVKVKTTGALWKLVRRLERFPRIQMFMFRLAMRLYYGSTNRAQRRARPPRKTKRARQRQLKKAARRRHEKVAKEARHNRRVNRQRQRPHKRKRG